MNFKWIITGVVVISGLVLAMLTMGVNDAGFRTVVQMPTGNMWVKSDPGWYWAPFAKTTVYPDYLTYDFSAQDGHCNFKNDDGSVDGIKVRYQDGGEGAVCGLVRIQLPAAEDQMIAFHKAYVNATGVRSKLLNQAIPKAINLTAALMSSEEAYATKRSEFIQMAEDQSIRGIYRTRLVEKTVEAGLDANGEVEYQTKEVPEPIMGDNGQYRTDGSDFEQYGVSVSQFDLKAWDFEDKTLKQISDKREAEMKIVTAKANADTAFYEQVRVEAEGKKNVAQAEYEELEKAKREIVNSEKERDMAVIAANRSVLVAAEGVKRAEQEVLEQEQLALAAAEEAKKITILADAVAYEKRVIIEADNALQAKLDAEVAIQDKWATAFKDRKVPANVTILGGDTSGGATTVGGDTEVLNFLRLKTAEAANNLSYDRKVNNSSK